MHSQSASHRTVTLQGGDLHNKEDGECYHQGRLQIFEARRVPRNNKGEKENDALEGQLPNGDLPGSVLEPEIQHDLRDDGVNGAVENPAFYCEGEIAQGEIRVPPKNTWATSPSSRPFHSAAALARLDRNPDGLDFTLTVKAKHDEQNEPDRKGCYNVSIGPGIRAAAPNLERVG